MNPYPIEIMTDDTHAWIYSFGDPPVSCHIDLVVRTMPDGHHRWFAYWQGKEIEIATDARYRYGMELRELDRKLRSRHEMELRELDHKLRSQHEHV